MNNSITDINTHNNSISFNLFGCDSDFFGNLMPNSIRESIIENIQNRYYDSEDVTNDFIGFNISDKFFDFDLLR